MTTQLNTPAVNRIFDKVATFITIAGDLVIAYFILKFMIMFSGFNPLIVLIGSIILTVLGSIVGYLLITYKEIDVINGKKLLIRRIILIINCLPFIAFSFIPTA